MIRIVPTDDGHEVDIRIRLPDGTKVRSRCRSPVSGKVATKEWAAARERELLQRGLAPKAKKPGPTIRAFEPAYLEHCRANRQKHSTINLKETIFRTWLLPQLGDVRIGELEARHLQKLKLAMRDRSRKYLNNTLTQVSRIMKVALELGEIDVIPVQVKLLKSSTGEMTFHDFDDYERLISAAESIDPRTHLVCLLGGEAGLRSGEIAGLEWRDLDLKRQHINIQRAVWRGVTDKPKGGKSRRVPMTRRLLAALQRFPRSGERILGSPSNKVMVGWLQQASKRASVTGKLHKLRHTFCSHLAMRGAPVRSIQELAGHVEITTTLKYMHLSPTATKAAIELLEPRGFSGDSRFSTSANSWDN